MEHLLIWLAILWKIQRRLEPNKGANSHASYYMKLMYLVVVQYADRKCYEGCTDSGAA